MCNYFVTITPDFIHLVGNLNSRLLLQDLQQRIVRPFIDRFHCDTSNENGLFTLFIEVNETPAATYPHFLDNTTINLRR